MGDIFILIFKRITIFNSILMIIHCLFHPDLGEFEYMFIVIILLNKKDVDIKLLNECRDEETSMLIKDYNIIGKVFDDFLEHNIFTKDELKEKLSIFASNDFEVSIHDLSHINYLNEDITSLLEGLVNQADEKTDVNIILLNEKIINIIKVIYKCVFIDVKKEDWLSILIDFIKEQQRCSFIFIF